MVLSIVIPAYNAACFISRCLESIYRSVLAEELFEVIVINDGSEDSTSCMVMDFANQHTNIKLINQNNSGVSVSRDVGIRIANGEYILFVDADDELVDGALPRVCHYLEKRAPLDMLVTRQVYGSGREYYPSCFEENKSYSGIDAYHHQYVRTNAGGAICNTDFLRRNNLEFPIGVKNGEDTIFFTMLQMYAQSILFYDLALYQINEVNDSASRKDTSVLAQRMVESLNVVARIKKDLVVTDQQMGIFDYMVYQVLSNCTSYYICSRELSYKSMRKHVDLDVLLPLRTRQMFIMRRNACLMNFSFLLFYLLNWTKKKLCL